MVTIDCKYTKKNSTCKNKNQNNKHLQCENNIFCAMQMLIYSMPSDYTYLNSVYRQVTIQQNK